MKFAVLMSIARQVEGEYVFVRVVKAHTNPDKLHRYLRETDLPRVAKLGEADCTLEYGIIENIEVETDESTVQSA